MPEKFPDLTPAEIERLALLAEEAGEIVQAVGKILRHGYRAQHPGGGDHNRALLEAEVGDLMTVVDLMTAAGDIGWSGIREAQESKHERLQRFLHHQGGVHGKE